MLIATDLASRGIDVADISHIINYDIPEDPEVYVHRIGRTARMGAKGKAFTFVMRDQGDELTKVENLINMVIPQATLEGLEARARRPPTGPKARPARCSSPKPSRSSTASSGPTRRAAARRLGRRDAEPITIQAPPRTIGSKIPINRRHKRRR